MRFSAPALLAAALLVSGCNKKDKAPAAEPAGSAAPMPAAPTPTAPAPASPPPAAPAPAAGGSVVPSAKLGEITLPTPKGVPAKGIWSAAKPVKDGDREDNFVDGSDYWISLRFLDCNLPMVQEVASKSAEERGEFNYCFDAPTGKLKDYPLFNKNDTARAVKVGHLVVIAGLGATGEAKLKAADLEALLESLDLASLAKL